MTTFSADDLGARLISGGVIVFTIRPPQPGSEGWAVHFRERVKETVWHYGKAKPTLEAAMMDALEKIEKLLENRNVSHVAFGHTTVPGPKRFASAEMRDRSFHRGDGDTVGEAVDNLVATIEGKKGTPKKQAEVEKAKPIDPLEDLLG